MTFPFKEKIKGNIFPILLLIITTLILQNWVINPNNFFFLDDWDHLFKGKFVSFSELFSFFPRQMYNDRPIGFIINKILFIIFGLNSQAFHIFYFCLHLINSLLVYFLVKKIILFFKFNYSYFIPLCVSLFFANWPRSIMAIQWPAAVFDSFGCFIVLIYLNLVFLKNKNFIIKIITFLIFFIGIRTKEAVLTISLIPIIASIIKYKKIKIKYFLTPEFFLSLIYIGAIIFFTITTHNQGYDKTNAYYPSFNPINIFITFIKYLYFYFSLLDPGFSFVNFSISGLIISITALSIGIYGIYIKKNRTNPLLLFLAISFIISISTVLVFVNRQQRLYFYIPSIFLSFFVIIIIKKIINKEILVLLITLFILFLVNKFNPVQKLEINWWLQSANSNQKAYNNLKNIPYSKTYYFYNINDPATNFLLYGPGFAAKIFFNDPKIKIVGIDQSSALKINTVAQCFVNYNSMNLIPVNCKENK